MENSAQVKTIRVRTKDLTVDKEALSKIKLIGVAYSHVEKDFFPTDDAYKAEAEVEKRAQEVMEVLTKLGYNVKGYPGDPYFLTHILIDKPDIIVNLVDTVRGKDSLQTSVPAILDFVNIQYTGSDMPGLVIGNNKNLIKQLLGVNGIPTPEYKYIKDLRSNVAPDFEPPYIVKINEGGGSVGIDDHAVKEDKEALRKKVEEMVSAYKMPVLVEKFIGGPELTAVLLDDGTRKHIFLAQKKFRQMMDGKHYFTSIDSYDDEKSYTYKFVDEAIEEKVVPYVIKAFNVLKYRDYAKFDIRLDENDNTPYFIDCNPNTAFGPDMGLPMTEVADLFGVSFVDMIQSLLTKHIKSKQ